MYINREAAEVFPPQQGEQLQEIVRQAPELHGIERSRWRLADLLAVPTLPWLRGYTLAGICKALQRLRIKSKQGRLHIHSPDRAYLIKMRWIRRALELARTDPDSVSFLYADEFSFYRQPHTGGGVYYPAGEEPTCPMYAGYNTRHRVGATLDAYTGKAVWVDGDIVGVDALCKLLTKVRESYGEERTIFLAWDNWHIHYQRDVAAKAAELNIQLLWLPTYAPWTNPIEKLWRWLKQTHIRNHRYAGQFDLLISKVREFLRAFEHGSPDLLRYVGLDLDRHTPITGLMS